MLHLHTQIQDFFVGARGAARAEIPVLFLRPFGAYMAQELTASTDVEIDKEFAHSFVDCHRSEIAAATWRLHPAWTFLIVVSLSLRMEICKAAQVHPFSLSIPKPHWMSRIPLW